LKIFRAKRLAALGLILVVGQSNATDRANCRGIDNVLERLACYDESHKEQTESRSLEDRKDNSSKSGGLNNIFADRDGQVVTTTLTEINKLPRSGAILYLANNQVWQFVKKRSLNAKPGDEVIIKRGFIGDYLISVDGSSFIPVKRLERPPT
jgi:hypothetical protein